MCILKSGKSKMINYNQSKLIKSLLIALCIPSIAFSSIVAKTIAATGSVKVGIPTIGHAYFEYEIHNDADRSMHCTIVRGACMNAPNNCVDDTQVHDIRRGGRIRDYGSYLNIPVTYHWPGTAYTGSWIIFYECGSVTKRFESREHYQVKTY